MSVVEISNLRVDYDEVIAVHNISFHLEAGKIYGFVGPNGAGKTTTIKALAGLIEPKQGTILLRGYNLETEREKALARVGYMPDSPPVYENLKVWEYLDVFAAAYGYKAPTRSHHVDKWLEKVHLGNKKNSLVKELSRGMRQRLVLAKIVQSEPDILLLDEPASGLDPLARKQVRDLLKEASANGSTILISSHILPELSEFSDSIIIMEKGLLVLAGTIDEIRHQTGGHQKLMLKFANETKDRAIFENLLMSEGIPETSVVREKSKYIVHFQKNDEDASLFLKKLITQGVFLTECSLKNDDIEEIFLKVGAKEVS
jgi:ABC-2 type transport system ATP-binding protein